MSDLTKRTFTSVSDGRYVVGTRLVSVVAEGRADGAGAGAAQVLRHLRHVRCRRREVEARRNLGGRPHDGRERRGTCERRSTN